MTAAPRQPLTDILDLHETDSRPEETLSGSVIPSPAGVTSRYPSCRRSG